MGSLEGTASTHPGDGTGTAPSQQRAQGRHRQAEKRALILRGRASWEQQVMGWVAEGSGDHFSPAGSICEALHRPPARCRCWEKGEKSSSVKKATRKNTHLARRTFGEGFEKSCMFSLYFHKK